jgi:hypothetical protein
MSQMTNIPEWESIQMGSISDSELHRHFMFLGETGSGKTVSGILPLCRLAFSNQKEFPSAGLVIDPKSEIGDYLANALGDEAEKRMIRIRSGKPGPILWQFENVSIEGRNGKSLMEEIMTFADSYNGQKDSTHDRFWVDSSSQIISEIISIDIALYNHKNGLGTANIDHFWFNFYAFLELANPDRGFEESQQLLTAINNRQFSSCLLMYLLEDSCIKDELRKIRHFVYKKENYLSHILKLMEASTYLGAKALRSGDVSLDLSYSNRNYNYFWAIFIGFLEAYTIDGIHLLADQTAFFRQFTCMDEALYSSLQTVFNSLINEFVDKEFYGKISINPFECPVGMLSTKEVIENGQIVVYEPGLVTSVTACVGKVLKACFFKSLLVAERLNNPVVRQFFYICDEFHKFITHDEQSGEQSFLDRCRAYRVCCALATQSLSSLRYVFAGEKGNQAINILVTNTGTKLFFRSTDPGTTGMLMDLIPEPYSKERPHVVRVRPPATMQPGECYYVLVNGKVGRGQVRI